MGDLLKRYWSTAPWLTRVFILIPILLLIIPPLSGWESETIKNLFWSFSILGILWWFLVRLLSNQKFAWPSRPLAVILGLWSLVIILSFWWSPPRDLSWWGLELGTDSAWFLLTLVAAIYLAREFFDSETKIGLWHLGWSLGAGLLIISQLIFWGRPELAAVLGLPIGVGNLIGKWNDFGLIMAFNSLFFAGLAAFSFCRSRRFSLGWFSLTALLSLVSLGLAVLVNFLSAWFILVALALLLLSILLARRRDWQLPVLSFLPLIIILLTAFIFIASADQDSWLLEKLLPLQRRLRIASLEVRPSLTATLTIARGVLSQETWLGVGPGKFERAWWQFRPAAGINETRFWSSDFQTGFSWLISKFITLGVLGGATALFLVGAFLWALGRLLFRLVPARAAPAPGLLLVGAAGLYWLGALLLYSPGSVVIVIAWVSAGLVLGVSAVNRAESAVSAPTSRLGSVTLINAALVIFCFLILAGGFLLGTRSWALWHYVRAEQFSAAKNFLAAEAALDKAVSLKPLTFGYRRLVENNLRQLEALSRTGEAEHIRARFKAVVDGALKAVSAATARDAGDYRNWLLQGRVYEVLHGLGVTGSYEEAFAAYQTAVWLNPNNPQLWFELARLAASNEDWASAEAELGEALKRKSDFTPALLLWVQIKDVQGEAEAAVRTLKTAAAAAPNDFGLWFQLGYWQYRRGEYPEAVETLTTAWRLRPTSAETYYFLALSYEAVGDPRAARQWLEPLIRQEPDNPTIINLMNRLDLVE